MIKKRLKFVFRYLPGLFLSGLLLLSGCSQDDASDIPAGSRVIDFRAQGGMSSLKATTTGADYIHSFAVNARYREGDDWDGKFLLQGTTVYREAGGTDWTYSPQAYFPTESGTVDFFAYSPSGSKNKVNGFGTDENQTITYEVPVPSLGSGATSQEDLLVAYESLGSDIYTGVSPVVNLQFRHALSRISVSASSSLTEPVRITKLELKNLKSSGSLSLKGNMSTGADKSNGIPKSSGTSEIQTDWFYTALSAVDDIDDYVVLWEPLPTSASPSLASYPYLLPESGVQVSKSGFKSVVGADQGMFVMPQTTVGNPDGDTKEGVTEENEFGLYIEYFIGDGVTPSDGYVQFGDIADEPIADTGVTFEIGRQYVLNLTFGAGGNDGDPSINIGAVITFSPLVDEKLDGPVVVPPPDPDHDPAATNFWAASNIYFKPDDQAAGDGDGTGDGDVGTLTFAESKADGMIGGKEGYQGVYFKWGSLIGVSTNTSGSDYDNNNTFLFIPNLATGKYHKYKVGNVTSTQDGIVDAYLDKATGNAWVNIPCADDSGLTTGRGVDALSGIHNPDNYKGDICRYLSAKRSVNGSGLVSEWRIPVSDLFAGSGYQTGFPYKPDGPDGSVWNPNPSWSGFSGSDTNGASQTANAFMTYMYSLTGETVFFPVSGRHLAATWAALATTATTGRRQPTMGRTRNTCTSSVASCTRPTASAGRTVIVFGVSGYSRRIVAP